MRKEVDQSQIFILLNDVRKHFVDLCDVIKVSVMQRIHTFTSGAVNCSGELACVQVDCFVNKRRRSSSGCLRTDKLSNYIGENSHAKTI